MTAVFMHRHGVPEATTYECKAKHGWLRIRGEVPAAIRCRERKAKAAFGRCDVGPGYLEASWIKMYDRPYSYKGRLV